VIQQRAAVKRQCPRLPARAHWIHVMRIHLPARDHVVVDWAPALYMIRVDGHLGAMALYGVLAEMEALGLVLLEVRQTEPHGTSLRDLASAEAPPGAGRITEIQ
jgi:hypothetical protein